MAQDVPAGTKRGSTEENSKLRIKKSKLKIKDEKVFDYIGSGTDGNWLSSQTGAAGKANS